MELFIKPLDGPIQGEIRVPGDKSISHRAALFAGMAAGKSQVTGFLTSEDCLRTLDALSSLGVSIEREGEEISIDSPGLAGLTEPGDIVDCGNSGTGIRLLAGLVSGLPHLTILTGDASIRRRPMGRVTEPLRAMGAQIWGRGGGRLAPLAIRGGELNPIHYHSPLASAQVKSAVLLAGLSAPGQTRCTEPHLSRDHTERLLPVFGVPVGREGTTVWVEGPATLRPARIQVPGDISSAAFFMVLAATRPGSELIIRGVGLNPTRTGIIDILRQMGAEIHVEICHAQGEPYGDLLIRGGELHGVEIGGEIIPRLIDEIPILAVAAALAQGETRVRDAQDLRAKESDRIATTAGELRKFGIRTQEHPDGLSIWGGRPQAAIGDSHGDHRIAMSLAILALQAPNESQITGCGAIGTSFPSFSHLLGELVGGERIRRS